MKKNREEVFAITGFTKKGHGLGHFDRQDGERPPVEVMHTIPGDRVRVKMLPRRKRIYRSLLEEIVSPASNRIKPHCAHFGQCGGCRWQMLDYKDQLSLKEERVRAHISSAWPEELESVWHPMIPCDPPWQYRNKMDYSFSQNRRGDRFLGLMAAGSQGRVLNLQECHLPNPWHMDALQAVRTWWQESGLEAYFPPANSGSLRNLTLREGMATGDRMAVLLLSGNPDYALSKEQMNGFRDALLETIQPAQTGAKLSLFVRIQQIMKGQPTQFFEMLLSGPDHIREVLTVDGGETFEMEIGPSTFFQPSTRQAEKLYSRALQLANIPPDSVVFDLYCGAGMLGMLAASQAKRVVGIELSPESALDARENVKRNGLTNVEIITGDVGVVLSDLEGGKSDLQPDVAMIDPPRVGLDEKAINHLLRLKANKIIYISCSPASQAENLKELLPAGYTITAIQPVDQFPHTLHIENIVVLERMH